MKGKTEFITGIIVGATITFFIILIWMSSTFGRMSNHLDCDMSKDKIEAVLDSIGSNTVFIERDMHYDVYLFDKHVGYYYSDTNEYEFILTGKTK